MIGVFGALALGGLIIFATYGGFIGEPNPYGESVEIWGTLDRRAFATTLREITEGNDDFKVVSYREIDPRTFENELINAIAEGRGPDAIVLSSNLLLKQRAKLYPIPYETLSTRVFRDTFVDGAEIFQFAEGTYGIPFAVDPLVMYWNRSIFASGGLAQPPSTWEEVAASTVSRLTAKTPDFRITRSAIAFGEYRNVQNAKEILLMLTSQAGSPLITPRNDGFEAALNRSVGQQGGRPPGEAALDFYTQFANPAQGTYSWNRSLPLDRQVFLAGDLALYFGFGSELQELINGNPNLNFDAAVVPQGSGAPLRSSIGTFYSFAILRSTDNFGGAYQAIVALTNASAAGTLAQNVGLAPVHRSVIARGHGNSFQQTIYNSALVTRGWLDPDEGASDNIFATMVEDVTSGRERASAAVNDAEGRLNQLFR